jgi:peptide/nickel transport system permease protein
MIRFLLRRFAWSALVIWIVATSVFVIYFAVPHDVARLIAGRQASEETVKIVRARLGLDRPAHVQYISFLGRLARGDLGQSFITQEPVNAIVARDLPVTASLALGGAVLWLALGVSAGVLAAKKRGSFADRVITTVSLGFYSMPTFLLGQLLLFFLFFRLYMAGFKLFPPGSYVAFSDSPLQWARFLALPWLSIALVTAATYSRLTRGAMLDVLEQDYIRTARAKGLKESRITWRHALRSSLTPVVSQFGRSWHAVGGRHCHRSGIRASRARP